MRAIRISDRCCLSQRASARRGLECFDCKFYVSGLRLSVGSSKETISPTSLPTLTLTSNSVWTRGEERTGTEGEGKMASGREGALLKLIGKGGSASDCLIGGVGASRNISLQATHYILPPVHRL